MLRLKRIVCGVRFLPVFYMTFVYQIGVRSIRILKQVWFLEKLNGAKSDEILKEMEYTVHTKTKEVNLMRNTVIFQTPLSPVGISEQDGAITELFLAKDAQDSVGGQATPLLKEAEKQILGYLAGTRKTFDLPLAVEGTEFQKIVWEALRSIPYGETRSYKQVAEMIGQPDASRAVGMANNRNPILILTPCHRVLGSDGELVGYAAGLDIKKKLLELERSHVSR